MKEKISGNLKIFSAYYKETPLRRVIVGLLLGGLLWFSFFTITLILDFSTNDTVWWYTFLKDLPWLGGVIALLVSLQIWGLLPQPANDDEQLSIDSVKNIEDSDPTNDKTSTEGSKTEVETT